MSDKRTLEIPLPAGVTATEEDIAFMHAACQSVVAICLDEERTWLETLQKLEKEEWQVNWGLQWSVEAKRGRCIETAIAPTIKEAFSQLSDLARLHAVEGCP